MKKLVLSPSFKALLASFEKRSSFQSVVAVRVAGWADIEAASVWCERRWRSHGQHYRRRVDAANQSALFEFASPMHSFALRLTLARRRWSGLR